jgi:RNA polymerase sigma factor (sigma-70 family)
MPSPRCRGGNARQRNQIPKKNLSDFLRPGYLMGEMQPKSDAQLLREYAESGSESAFTELVTRHTDLVYSAALRQAPSSDLACDVTQNVFTSLARGARTLAGKLNPDASLAGWLCRCTRNLALNLRRDDFRRHSRERQAMETLHPSTETAPDWDRLRPILDEAISGLNEADHDALVLRFFKNQDLRSVGLALGVSDDTAQKRVARALEKMREFLAHHGITTTGAALAMTLAANAVQAAPVGLAATISAAGILAGTAVHTSTVIAVTKTIAMTTIQKTIITATLAVVAGAGIYETHQAAQLRGQNQTLQQQQAPLVDQIQQLQKEFADSTNRMADLLVENARLRSNPIQSELLKLRGEVTQLKTAEMQKKSDPFEAAANARVAKVNQLKQRLEQMPYEKIPELQYLTTQDWLRGATYSGDLKTDDDFDRALSQLRRDAKRTFAYSIGEALANYIAGNNGQLPGDISQLRSYFNPPIDGTILQRYQLLQTGNLSDIPNNEPLIAEKAPVDDQYDTLFKISATGFSYQGTGTSWVNGSGKGDFGTNITMKIKPFERQN